MNGFSPSGEIFQCTVDVGRLDKHSRKRVSGFFDFADQGVQFYPPGTFLKFNKTDIKVGKITFQNTQRKGMYGGGQ